jgi:serine/threonine-protein kinase HipA
MSKKRCLYCYQELAESETDFHPICSRKFFEKPSPPILPYSEEQMLELAERAIKSHTTVTGVQPKLSLSIETSASERIPEKLTIVDMMGNYILKPSTTYYPHLAELEDLTMHLAALAGINTVPHSLIRLQSGQLAYITRRIDRHKKGKYHMEDMCQLTERLTEHKYRGSYEQIGKAIVKYSVNPGLDIINFFEQVVFCFLTGNNDMHLKNFSLFKDPKIGYSLSPAYDMVASALVVEGDKEELALTLNSKKRRIRRTDFKTAMSHFGMDERAFGNIFGRFQKAIPKWHSFIEFSFIPDAMKEEYHHVINSRAAQIEIV